MRDAPMRDYCVALEIAYDCDDGDVEYSEEYFHCLAVDSIDAADQALDQFPGARVLSVYDETDDGSDDGQPDEMQEWHDFDPDC